ncbi:MAG: hypothetical protein Q4C83_03450 [Candidatus Saccharibacteria bacterium]|nr:hypothetical protein [Candidatus Saccharibacteria bacterium]
MKKDIAIYSFGAIDVVSVGGFDLKSVCLQLAFHLDTEKLFSGDNAEEINDWLELRAWADALRELFINPIPAGLLVTHFDQEDYEDSSLEDVVRKTSESVAIELPSGKIKHPCCMHIIVEDKEVLTKQAAEEVMSLAEGILTKSLYFVEASPELSSLSVSNEAIDSLLMQHIRDYDSLRKAWYTYGHDFAVLAADLAEISVEATPTMVMGAMEIFAHPERFFL